MKKFTEATAEKAIKYCLKWITIAGFRQKVCESMINQVDAGKSFVGECYHFGRIMSSAFKMVEVQSSAKSDI